MRSIPKIYITLHLINKTEAADRTALMPPIIPLCQLDRISLRRQEQVILSKGITLTRMAQENAIMIAQWQAMGIGKL